MQPNCTPHPAKALIHNASNRRFRIVCTGRRFGKTLLLAAELLDRGAHETPGTFGWVAPTCNVAQRGVEAFRAISTRRRGLRTENRRDWTFFCVA